MKQRTTQQNKALHKYMTELANAMTEKGHSLQDVLRADWDIPPTPDTIKAVIVKPLCKAMFGTDKTSQLETHQVTQLYEVINKNFGEKVGIHVAFPSQEELSILAMDNEA